jgi:hypothetical protein
MRYLILVLTAGSVMFGAAASAVAFDGKTYINQQSRYVR